MPPDVRSLVRRRITRLPPPTRRALFRAAALAQPTASRLGRSFEAALQSGLVEELADGRIAFTHPLYASAVDEATPPDERRRVHRELASQVGDIEERAHHLALAATGPDESVGSPDPGVS